MRTFSSISTRSLNLGAHGYLENASIDSTFTKFALNSLS